MTNGYSPAIVPPPGGDLWHLHWQTTHNIEGKSSLVQSFSNCKCGTTRGWVEAFASKQSLLPWQKPGVQCVDFYPIKWFCLNSWYSLSFTTFLGTGSVGTNASSCVFLLASSLIPVSRKFPYVLSSLQKILRRGGKNTQKNCIKKIFTTQIIMMVWSLT